MSEQNANTLLGCKLFKEREDSDFDIVRITRIYSPEKVRVTDSEGNNTKRLVRELREEGYSVLESIGVISFSTVSINNNNDVVVTLLRRADAMAGVNVPCVICRQSVTDFFYTLLSEEYDHGMVGVSVSDRTCPTNINYAELLACNEILYSDMVNIYYDDTLNTVLECVNTIKFNDVLRKLYEKHVDATNNPVLKLKKADKGWCSDIKLLLEQNNFWIDVDQSFGITDVDFEIDNYIIEKKDEAEQSYYSLPSDLLQFFSSTFQINIVDCIISEYGYDIDLAEYRNENYVLIRDSKDKLYLMVYRIDGAYLEQDISIQKEKEYLANTFRLRIFDKYKEQNK
jgi:hypothetical protein